MATALDREVRKTLGTAVRKARIVAEDGARKALTELGIEDAKRPEGLSTAQADLRNRLRAHARSLGDAMQSDGSIKANRLVREIAYEHWHRALFARFLAENNLLIDPDHRVAVSLSGLEEIAKEEGSDLIELAADWAEPMLPQIFRKDDPVLALALPPETKAGITEIVKDLPRAVFAADDSLGWVYQFWQADQKDRVNESEVKIGADELPAVTQLFTEDYMVLFLLENTLGAWWAGKVLAADRALAADAVSEDELREKTSPPGYRWTYLRFVRESREGETHETATGHWQPAAGVFEGWPKAAKGITVLDPCMGSGHFLVFALSILVAIRRAEEGLEEETAVKAVLADNLFGLEIDLRCTQIAAFALALASWKRLGGPEPLPKLHLACSGLAIGLGKTEFLKLAENVAEAEGWTGKTDLLGTDRTPLGERAAARQRGGLTTLYELFEKAPTLGSLIDPRRAMAGDFGNLFEEGFDGLDRVLQKILGAADVSHEVRETAVTAQGLAKATELLARQYALVSTNVPYLGRGRQSALLQKFSETHFADAKSDLCVTFLQRLRNLCAGGGKVCAVSPQNWLSLHGYKKFRNRFLTENRIDLIALLGPGGFEEISGEVVTTTLIVFERGREHARMAGIDVQAATGSIRKAKALITEPVQTNPQDNQLRNPDGRIIVKLSNWDGLLELYCSSFLGLGTGDFPAFGRNFWEFPSLLPGWAWHQMAIESTGVWTGRSHVISWDIDEGRVRGLSFAHREQIHNQDQSGRQAWGERGVAVNLSSDLNATLFSGETYEKAVAALIPKQSDILPAIWCFVRDPDFSRRVQQLDPRPIVANATLLKVPFDLEKWREVATEQYPNGLPRPYSNDPTQWLFDGHPRGSADPNAAVNRGLNQPLAMSRGVRGGMAEHPLQVAVARLLGYRWPRQAGSSFMDCPAVPEPDEIDCSGLVDIDGIVSLPALAGEADAATRLRDLIRAVWGPAYGEGAIRDLLVAEQAKATDLATWLADEFFDGHCKLFHQTPFIWHVWDGVRGGFSALVNYHRLCEGNGAGRRLLEKLRDSYLGEWIAAQRRGLAAGEAGAEQRLIAAEHLRGELTKIIDGDPPYDIFVRWKPLHRQPMGWEPDIDDGVRLNIRPFLASKPKNSGRKDACILRVTPRVKKHAGADRGAEPHREKESFPWFWAEDNDVATEDFAGGTQFKGRRYNDFHYTRAFKQRVRDAKASAVSGAPSEPALEKQGRAS
jgi:hypothetical protein